MPELNGLFTVYQHRGEVDPLVSQVFINQQTARSCRGKHHMAYAQSESSREHELCLTLSEPKVPFA